MDPLNCYKTYLALKNHFTKEKYDYHKYCGKTNASLNSFYKRKDRFWFEKLSRNKSDDEVVNFFIANFVMCDDPQSLWIGEIIREGEDNYKKWNKKIQSLSYTFKEEISSIFNSKNFDSVFLIENNRHPELLKYYLQGKISIETLLILDYILDFTKNFDKKLDDPIWNFISLKIKKYKSFLHINVFKFKKILKECVL